MITVEDILAENKSLSKKDRMLIQKAAKYSEIAHFGQTRAEGVPYYTHTFHTGKILASLGMPSHVIAAGILHDTIEDTDTTPQYLEENFGKDIAFYVSSVTKLGSVRYHGFNNYVNDLQKLFVATSRDLRVIIIKLADRLHNMRTIEFLPEEKRKKISIETMDLYAPIAARLGIHDIKQELEDLSFKNLKEEHFNKISSLLKKKSKDRILKKFYRSLNRHLAEKGIKSFLIQKRVKTAYSTYKKMQLKKRGFEEIHDVIAVRIIVKDIDTIYKILGIIHSLWRPIEGSLKDYISHPKLNGYRSLHTRIYFGNSIVEIQMRTKSMDEIARFGVAAHSNYKENIKNPQSVVSWFMQLLPKKKKITEKNAIPQWIKMISEIHSNDVSEEIFMKDVRTDFLEERMFVFTPLQDVIDLPIGATVLDFAYAVHEDIGNYADGGYVNNKFVSLTTTLSNGDIVKIHKSKKPIDHTDILQFVKTARARWAIKKFSRVSKEKSS